MDESAYHQAGEQNRPETAIDLLDIQINRYEACLDSLRKKVEPVISRYEEDTEKTSAPRIEPKSHLAGRAHRLLDLNLRLEQIIEGLDI